MQNLTIMSLISFLLSKEFGLDYFHFLLLTKLYFI